MLRLTVHGKPRTRRAERSAADSVGQPMRIVFESFIGREARNSVPQDAACPAVAWIARLRQYRADCERRGRMFGRKGTSPRPPMIRTDSLVRPLAPRGVIQEVR